MEPEEQDTDYSVAWYIPITAASPKQAALIARGLQLDPQLTATIFAVTNIATQETLNIDTQYLTEE